MRNPNSHNSMYQGLCTNFHLFCLGLGFFPPNIAFNIPTLDSFLVDFVSFCFRTLGVVCLGFFICKVEKDISNMLLIQECE